MPLAASAGVIPKGFHIMVFLEIPASTQNTGNPELAKIGKKTVILLHGLSKSETEVYYHIRHTLSNAARKS